MRLFLSSENLGNYPEIFLKMVGDGKLAVNHNAIDYWSDKDRQEKVEAHLEQLKDQGFKPEELDLRDFFAKQDKLAKKMEEFSGMFVFGGNTFILRRAMAASGLDRILQDWIPGNRLAYGGSSAGSCICAKSLHGIEQGDRPHPEDVPSDYPSKEIIWDGLGLVDFMVVPHYGSTWFAKEADATIKYLEKHGLPYKILKDGQVIIINGDKEEFLK